MLKELYTRDSEDPLYRPDVIEIESSLENILGQIRMLLFTKPGEVINDLSFGIDLESLIFNTNLNNKSIEQKVLDSIYKYCADTGEFEITVKADFFRGTARDACIIDVIIDGTKYLGVLIK